MDTASAQSVERAYEPIEDELSVALTPAEGALPADLRGVLYRNGPGRMSRFGHRYGHPFDGDGMVTRFALGAGRCAYRNRYVRTEEFVAEERAGRLLYRGFGTNLPGGPLRNALRLRFKNAANTSVLWHGGVLLALWEGGLPHRLDPETLETLGPHDFAGRLRNPEGPLSRAMSKVLPFSAHPRRSHEGILYNFGLVSGLRSRLALYQVDPDGRMRAPTFQALDDLVFLHDFALTPRYQVFFLYPVAFDLLSTFLGVATPAGSIRAVPGKPTRILLLPRAGGPPIVCEAPPCFIFHFAGAYDQPDGTVVVHGIHMDRFPDLSSTGGMADLLSRPLPRPLLSRYLLDPLRGTARREALTEHPAELPRIDPRREGLPHRYVYAVGDVPENHAPIFSRILRFDCAQGGALSRRFPGDIPGEPVFVPRPGGEEEDDGYVLVLVYRGAHHRSDLYVLSARDLSTCCRFELPHHVPPGFHGTFVPAAA